MRRPDPYTISALRVTVGILASFLLVLGWILNVSRPGRRVEGCPRSCAVALNETRSTLRVMTYNVLHGFPRFRLLRKRLDAIAIQIRRLDPDIICLQEVPWTPFTGHGARYLAHATGMNYVYLRANGNRYAILFEEGSAILSKYPLTPQGFVELKPQVSLFEHRIALHARADTPLGPVHVVATHLTTNAHSEANAAQAFALHDFVRKIGQEHVVIAGDFNALETLPHMRVLANDWIDTFRIANPQAPGFTCCADEAGSWPPAPLTKRIDYIFWKPAEGSNPQVVNSRVVLDEPVYLDETTFARPSDHAGVLSEIVWTGEGQ